MNGFNGRPPAAAEDNRLRPPMNRAAEWLLLNVAPTAAHGYIRLLHATMSIQASGREVLEEARRSPGRYILCFWHSRVMMMPYAYPGGRIVVLSSDHRDAEALVRVLRKFGIEQARGSTSKRSLTGMRQILRKVEDGCDVGMTPDGPKGPRRRVQPGVVAVARFTGLPIIPVGFSAAPARRLKTWDRTLVPKFFSKGLFLYGEPIRVRRDADDAEQEERRTALEAALDRVTDLADDAIGLPRE